MLALAHVRLTLLSLLRTPLPASCSPPGAIAATKGNATTEAGRSRFCSIECSFEGSKVR